MKKTFRRTLALALVLIILTFLPDVLRKASEADARDAARTVLAADPVLSAPEHAALRAQCARLFAANDGHFN